MGQSDSKLDLISGLIDGEITDDERREADLLLSSEEVRQLRDELLENRERLQAMPQVKAPGGLSDRIMAAVRQATPEPPQAVAAAAPESQTNPESPKVYDPATPRRGAEGKQSAGPLQKAMAAIAVAATLLLSASLIWKSQQDGDGGVPIVNVPKDPPKDPVVDPPTVIPRDPGPTFLPQELQVMDKFHYLLLFEFEVTEKAIRDEAFEGVLSQNGILLDQTIEVDKSLEKAFEASRVLGRKNKAKPGGKVAKLVLVDATLQSLFGVIEGFTARKEDVLSRRIDLSIEPGDANFMRQLEEKQMQIATTDTGSGSAFPINIETVKGVLRTAAAPTQALTSTITFEEARDKLKLMDTGEQRRMPVLFMLRVKD